MNLIEKITTEIKENGACNSFKGGTVEALVEQVFTSQGIEFLIKTGFPGIHEFREVLQQEDLKKFGIYVDCGRIDLSEERNVLLVGNTEAMLHYKDCQRNKVYVIHGAKADIKASGYAVIRLERDASSIANIEVLDKAVILR